MPNPFSRSYDAYLTANDLPSLSSARHTSSAPPTAAALAAL
jgi:hypothetical protein